MKEAASQYLGCPTLVGILRWGGTWGNEPTSQDWARASAEWAIFVEQLDAAYDEAVAYHRQSSEQADEARKWRLRAETAEQFVEACLEIVDRSRNPLAEITDRLGDFRATSNPASNPTVA